MESFPKNRRERERENKNSESWRTGPALAGRGEGHRVQRQNILTSLAAARGHGPQGRARRDLKGQFARDTIKYKQAKC